MRKITLRLGSLFMVMVLLLSTFPMNVGAVDEGWIEISDTAGLISIGSNPSGNYRLTADIDLAGSEWNPIGAFSGKLDGNSKVIKNLTINNTSVSNEGLFSSIDASGQISNLGIENAKITAGSSAGILAGTNSGTISSCYSKGTISGYENVGGLVGQNTGTIVNSFTQASVSAKDYFGGLAGYNSGTVQKSYAASSVLPSVFNNYLQFNGTPVGDYSVANSGGYIDITDKNVYVGDKFTLEAWFQWDDVGTSDCNFIMGKGYEQFEIHTGGESGVNGLRFIPIANNNRDSYIDVKNVIQSGWFHVAAVYEYNSTSHQATAQVFINGEPQDLYNGTTNLGKSATLNRDFNTLGYGKINWSNPLVAGNLKAENNNINIGRRTDGSFYFDGQISDVRFWNIARTGEEIKRDKDKVLIGNEPGLVGYWKLNEASGDAIDSSTTQNNGTLKGDVVRKSETTAAHKGGLIGYNTETGIVSNSYYDSQVSGQADAIGASKTTTEMKSVGTFTDWDFISTWGVNSEINSGYPYLLTKAQKIYVSGSGSDSNTGSIEAPFATINKALEVVPDKGTIILLSDLTQTGVSFATASKTVTIRSNVGATTPYIINDSGVTITDGFFNIKNGNILNLYDVSITGAKVSNRRGIYVSGGATLNMYAGTTVSNFTADYGAGVGVVGASTKFNMYGGIIFGNTSTANGGGVNVDSSAVFNMNGNAKISNNESKNYLGGGVYVNSGTFNMGESSIIENNSVTSSDGYASGFGGGVCLGTNASGPIVAFMNMTGNAIIRNNTATNQGGGVMIQYPGSFHMGGNASISGNTANYGAGISFTASDTLYLSESASITNNVAKYGGAGVNSWNKNFRISGSVVVSGNLVNSNPQNIVLDNSGIIIIDGGMTEGANVNVFTGSVMKSTYPSDYVKYFHADWVNYSFVESGDMFIRVQNQAAPTGLVGVAPTSYGLSDGKIKGTTTDMQYKPSAATEWIAVTGTEITGLSAGTYNVRYAAKTGYNVGTATDVVIAQGAKSTDATLNNLKIDGTTVAGFSANKLTYNVEIAAGTTIVPTVVATVTDTGRANAVVTAATSLPGTTSVLVTAEDGTTKTYTIKFIVVLATDDVTISDIPSYTYTGSEINADPTVKYGTIALVKGTDYDLSYSNNTNAGTATLTISFKGNYSGSATKSFTITKATREDISITNYNKEYDGESHSIAVTNTISGDTVKYSVDSGTTWLSENPVFTNAGEYTVNVKVTNANYNDLVRTGTVKITPKAVTINVTDSSKIYGAADPSFSGTVTGLVAPGDLGTVSYSRAGTDENAGTYADVLDASYTANGNYTVTVNKGDLTITPANTMTVSADNVVKTYDGNSYGVEAASNVPGAVIKYWNGTAYNLDASPTIANVANSPLTVKFQATHPNYTTVTGTATVTINPKAVTIDVAAASKVYGTADPAFSGTVTGLVASGDLGTVSYSRAGTDENAGTYTDVLAASYTANGNYTVTVNKGDLTITPASTMTVSAPNVVKTYDGNSYGVEATSNVPGAVIKYWNGTAYILDASPTIANVGDSPLTVKFQATHPNYATVTGTATVTINPKAVTIDVAAASKVYGAADPTFSGAVTGLVASGDLGTVSYSRTGTDENTGTYTDVLDASYTANSNYTVTVNKGDLTITPANTMTVSADNVVKTYDGNSYGVEATSNVPGAVIKYWNGTAYNLDASPTIANVGESPLTVKFQATHPNYSTVTGTATVTINPKAVTIDVSNANKVYGAADPTFSGTVTGLVASGDLGTVSYSRAGTDENAGTYADVLGASYTANGNYTVTVNKGDLTITPANTMTVSADNVVKTYDGNSYGVEATSNIPGAVIKYWNGTAYILDASPTIANVGESPLTVKFQATHPNYTTVTGTATVTINPKAVTIDVTNASKVYGAADPTFSGIVTGLVASGDLGTVSYSRSGTDENAGTYTDVLNASYTANGNYTVTVNKGDLTITQANTMTVSAANVVKTYDGNSYGVEAASNVPGAVIKYWNGTAYILDASPTIANVANSPLTVKFQATHPNYTTVTGTATVTINPKAVTINVTDSSKVYGAADPAFTGTVTGLVASGDLGTVGYSRTGTDENAGTYADVLGASYTANGNYTVTVNKGDLTITPANTMTVSAPNVVKTYDGNSYGVEAASNVAGAVIKYWNGTDYILTSSPTIANVANSPLTVKFQATHPNYATVTGTATVTINPKAVTIDVSNANKVYGAADPAFTGTVTGLAASGDIGTVSYSRAGTDENAGTYADVLGASYTANGNYTVTVNKGDLTITPAKTMTVSAANVVKTYDGNSYGVEAVSNIPGAVIKYWNGTAYNLDASPTIANVANSPLTVKFQATHPNYATVTGTATVTINPKAVTIDVTNASKVYGAADPTFSGTVTGLVASGDLGTVGYSRTGTDENAGTYADVLGASYTANSNYTVTVNKGNLTITPANTMTVSADNVVKTYDGNSYGVEATSNIPGAVIKYWNGTAYILDASPTISNVANSPLTVKFQATHPNYATVTGTATVTINPKAVTINVTDSSKVYGTADPTFSGTVTGLAASGDIGTVSYSRTNATVNDAGTYADVLDASYTANGNYTVTVNKGDLTITPANTMTVSAANVVKTYDGNSYGVEATSNVPGAVIKYWNGTAYNLDASPTIANVANSPLTVKFQATHPNYATVTGTATVTINPKAVTINVTDSSKVYGTADPTFSGTVTGLAESGDLGTVSYSRAGTDENVGTYADVLGASYTANGNYTVTVNKGNLTITPASTMTVSAANVVKTYDGNSYGVEAASNIPGAVIKYWNGTDYILTSSPTIANVANSPLTVKFQATHPNYVTVTGTATVTINPQAPIIQSAIAGDRHVKISWSAVEGSTGYKIFSSSTSGYIGLEFETVSGAEYSYDVTGLTNGQTYYFVVKAISLGGDSGYSNEVSAMPKTVPGVPTSVTAIAVNGRATVSFIAPTENGGSPITGYIVTSSPGNIQVTGTGTAIMVIGLTNGTTYTFTVKAENEVGTSSKSAVSNAVIPYNPSSGYSDGDSHRDSTPSIPSQTTNGVDIIVNGKTETAAEVKTTQNGNNTVTTIVIDDKKLEQRLVQEGKNAVVTIPVNNGAEVVVGQLNGQTVKNMETNDAVLEIKTGQATYTLPALQVNIDDISEEIGKNVTLKDIVVSIKISEPIEDTARIIEDTAKKNNYQIMVKPVEFEIACSSGNKTVEVSKFNAYVERLIAIPKDVDPYKITTGIILNADGTFSHVPTVITIIDGKYYAKINSLTNSVYSVISSPKNFTDVQNHWAKEAVNDMASRLVINGAPDGLFYPNKEITRAEFASIVIRALGLMRPGTGKDVFNDVLKSNWYYDAVSIAYEYGIISGYGNGKFGPDDTVTREQAMTMIAKAMKIIGLKFEMKDNEMNSLLLNYSDRAAASDYAKTSIAACLKAGIITGRSNNTIAPKNYITRAEVAVIVQKLLRKPGLI